MDSRQSRNPTQPGGNRQNPGQSSEKMDDISISKNLSNILRHTAEKLNLNLDAHGYIFVDDLLKLKRFTGVTPDDIKRIVKNNDKQRFSLITEERSQKLKIRANQGHSGKFEDLNLDLVPIEDPEKYPVVHGTYERNWTSISKEGLKKMKRVHIHFAPGLPGEDRVISGMRTTCDIYIYIDMKKALQDGLKFFMSANNVILSGGDKNGIIAPKYFSKVVHRNGNVLKEDPNQKKKLPVGMVVDDKSKNEQSKKKNKGNTEKTSTDKDASNPKKKKASEENDKTENAKNAENKKKGKNSKKEVAAEKALPVQGNPNENKPETAGKKKGADKSSTTVTENPGDAAKKKKNQDKKSSDKEAGDPKKKVSEENVKNEESKKKAKKSKKETEGETNSKDKEASNPKKKKMPQENKSEDAKNSESKKKKSPKEAEGEKKSTAKPAVNKADTADKKKGSAKSPASENSAAKATKDAAGSTNKTKNQDKKSSDPSKNAGAVTEKAQNKNAVKKDVKVNLPKLTPPRVFIITDAKDVRLNSLRQQPVVGVYVFKQKLKIAYVLISMPGTVFVFDPTVTKELLKELLAKTKSQKVMYDTSIVYDLYQQCGIVLYKGPVADIQIMQNYMDKRIIASLAEIVGEVCGKIPPPGYNPFFEKLSEKLQDKTKNVMKTFSYVSALRHLYENYKMIFETSRRATFTKYSKKFDEATRAKILKSSKNKATAGAGAAAKKPVSQPSSAVAPQQKSKKTKK